MLMTRRCFRSIFGLYLGRHSCAENINMDLGIKTKPISYLKANAARIAEEVKKSNQPMVITQNGEASMVIQSVKDYQQTQETLAMLKMLSQSQKDIQDKNTIPANKAFASLRKRRDLT